MTVRQLVELLQDMPAEDQLLEVRIGEHEPVAFVHRHYGVNPVGESTSHALFICLEGCKSHPGSNF